MNTVSAPLPCNTAPSRNERRERAFGTGYGRSSGYAARRGYVAAPRLAPFRCA